MTFPLSVIIAPSGRAIYVGRVPIELGKPGPLGTYTSLVFNTTEEAIAYAEALGHKVTLPITRKE